MPNEEELFQFCECGCGLRVTKLGNRFIQHHQNRGRVMSDEQKVQIAKTLTKPKPEARLCECGCGEYVKNGDRFIYQHHLRGINYVSKKLTKKKIKRKIPEAKLCDCGCGEYALSGNDYIAGHQTRGREPSLSHKKKISYSKMGMCSGEDNPNWKGGISFAPYCAKFTEKVKQQIRDLYNNCDFISGLPDYICNVSKSGRFRKLDVHHVDSNKMQGCDGVKWKLVPLSCRNHMRMNGNTAFWERLICYALEYDETYYNIKRIDIMEMIKWKQTTEVISNMF